MIETIISICLGIGLAASAGFRVFVPLFVLSLATHYGYVPVGESFTWIGSQAAMICLGIATVVEIFAYYIPFVDNLLDSIAIPLASIAGTIVMASTLVDLDPMLTWGLAIIAGGGTAAALNTATAKTRLASTATTWRLSQSNSFNNRNCNSIFCFSNINIFTSCRIFNCFVYFLCRNKII